MSPDHLKIPEGQVFNPENWKVVTTLEAPVSHLKNKKWDTQTCKVALIMPQVPGEGGLTTGFEMQIVEMMDGQIKKRGSSVRLAAMGTMGMAVSTYYGAGTMLIDNAYVMGQYYKSNPNLRTKVLNLQDHLKVFNAEEIVYHYYPLQSEYENLAIHLAPALAKFLDFSI